MTDWITPRELWLTSTMKPDFLSTLLLLDDPYWAMILQRVHGETERVITNFSYADVGHRSGSAVEVLENIAPADNCIVRTERRNG